MLLREHSHFDDERKRARKSVEFVFVDEGISLARPRRMGGEPGYDVCVAELVRSSHDPILVEVPHSFAHAITARVGNFADLSVSLLAMQPRLPSFGYHQHVGLTACPFCREMFEEGEREDCPVCGVALTDFSKLPPSLDAMHEGGDVPTAPELERLPLHYLGRGKAILTALALVGMGMFFLPWVHITLPFVDARSAYVMAQGRAGWLFGTLCAWLVLIPTVVSRRSIIQMRGARVAAAFLCAIPGVCVADLLFFPPKYDAYIPIRFEWSYPLWVTLALSLVGIVVSVTMLGGRLDDIRVSTGTSRGQHVH